MLAAERLADALPAGVPEPLAVMTTPADVAAVTAAAAEVDGVASAAPAPAAPGGDPDVAQVDVVLDAEPGTAASADAVLALRSALDDVGTRDALVGGVLVLLLRSVLAPVLLVLTVVASFAASLGASWLLFDQVLGFPAIDGPVVVLSLLFLVALGVDYNIFLTTRAREEAAVVGTRAGTLTALTVTGGVITSAGLVLAAVFAVLGVLPLITLTQIGVVVCVGVLLDTLFVRTVVVPALAFGLGERFWWPGRPHRPDSGAGTTASARVGGHSDHGPSAEGGPGAAGAGAGAVTAPTTSGAPRSTT